MSTSRRWATPRPLVLTGRRAPNQYIYMSPGVGLGMRHIRWLQGFFKAGTARRNPAIVGGDPHRPGELEMRTAQLAAATTTGSAAWPAGCSSSAPGVRHRASRGGSTSIPRPSSSAPHSMWKVNIRSASMRAYTGPESMNDAQLSP